MIVFIANYPTEDNLRDGMVQRIAAIDTLAEGKKRVYLSISFKRNFKRKTIHHDECTVEYLNYFVHARLIIRYIKDATTVYVHSIYNLFKIFFFYQSTKTILDIHGVVPEELELMKRYKFAKIYSMVEKNAIRNCVKLVHVTSSMLYHYENKYRLPLKHKSIILPIFESSNTTHNIDKWNSDFVKIAYVGGLQAWQNIDLMVDTIRSIGTNEELMQTYSFHLFFPQHQINIFQEKYDDITTFKNVHIGTLPKSEIINFLSTCHMGYVLRDSILVNRVACPTKLIEYMECGVVPIIKSPDIGDFNSLGYAYVDMTDLCRKQKLDELKSKADNNYHVLDKSHHMALESKTELKKLFSI